MLSLTKPGRVFDERVENRLKIKGRTADDFQNFAGRRLLLQRFGQSRLRSCNSLNSRTFSMAMTAWSAKVSSSAICFSVNGRLPCGES